MSATQRKTLVLNADWRPLDVHPLKFLTAEEAIKAVYSGKVDVVESWPEFFRSPTTQIAIPKIVVLRSYAPVDSKPKFCRRSIFLRDRYKCLYCGNKFSDHELTFDHVIPRSAGGTTCWENIATCCQNCNTQKANSMPNYSGRKGKGTLRLLKQPRQPTTAELLRNGMELIDPQIKEDWGSWLYWSAPLEP